MQIPTKFELGQQVYRITRETVSEFEWCKFCDAEHTTDILWRGQIRGADGSKKTCPECWGHGGKKVNHQQEWQVYPTPLTLGQVEVKYRKAYHAPTPSEFSNYGSQEALTEERYMAYETGIGSGSLWSADMLFATIEEAQAECDRLNAKPALTAAR